MESSGVLVFFHCAANTGYAIHSLERTFFRMAEEWSGNRDNVHFAYTSLAPGHPSGLPPDFRNLLEFDPKTSDLGELKALEDYVRDHGIALAFGFDQPVSRPCFRTMRDAGVQGLISYWGAPMSSLNHGFRLLMKRLEVRMNKDLPDLFLFESEAMARSATHGRGIPGSRVSVVHLGVDTERYRPEPGDAEYLSREFQIPRDRKVVYYSGHMEPRKGVHVLVSAAMELVGARSRRDAHFLILGDVKDEKELFLDQMGNHLAREFVTFGGYRKDIPLILPNIYLGVIPSTGWDSFTVSALEIASAGRPLIVSELQGLVETVEAGETGFVFPPGDHRRLAELIERFLDNPGEQDRMGGAARKRVLRNFSVQVQVEKLVRACRSVVSGNHV